MRAGEAAAVLGLLLVAGFAVVVTGCLSCAPRLDVRNCPPDIDTCLPRAGDPVADWDPELGALWPDVARLLGSLPSGDHGHADWTPAQAEAFWRFWDVPLDKPDKQVFLRSDGALFRVRVLEC